MSITRSATCCASSRWKAGGTRCAVIGEDLGTVPEGFREAMQAANVLSYRVLVFERHGDGSFKPPDEYPPLAAASAATHDLATLKGFWLGRDIAWRRRLGLYPDAAAEATEAAERGRDRHLLLDALAREGLLAPERFGEFLPADGEPAYGDALGEAILVYLARSRARLVLVQLEDIVGEAEQANLPGTTDGASQLAPTAVGAAGGAARRAGAGARRRAARGGAAALGGRMSEAAAR